MHILSNLRNNNSTNNTFRSCEKMTFKFQKTTEWEILVCNSFNALANCKSLCHTFTSHHFILENNIETALRHIKPKIWLPFATKLFANKISFWKDSLVPSLTRILPLLPDNFSVVFNFLLVCFYNSFWAWER